MATHCDILAWEIPWTEEPGGLQSTGLQRVRHERATKQQRLMTLSIFPRVYQLFNAFFAEVTCNTLSTIFKLAWLSFYY